LQRASSAGGHRVVDEGVPLRRTAVDVTCVTVDSWVERLGVEADGVSFVKIDAQGSELHILNGAARLLRARHVAWQIEVDVPLLARRGCSPGDLFAVLRAHFTHFIDLNRRAAGPRVRTTAELTDGLRYITVAPGSRTDVLTFNLQAPAAELLSS